MGACGILYLKIDHFLSQPKCPDFSKIMSGILDPRIPTFWNSASQLLKTFNVLDIGKLETYEANDVDPPEVE